MNRRTFLGAGTAAGAVALAGCLGGDTDLDWTGESVDGREHHQLFGDGAFVLTTRQLSPASDGQRRPVPFEVVLHHREGLRTDGFRLGLRAPPRDGSAFDAALFLASSRLPLRVERTDGWTTVAADGLGSAGESNVALDLFVVPTPSRPVDELLVDADVRLSEGGPVRRRYRARRLSSVPLARA